MDVPEYVDVPREHAVPEEARRGHELLDLGLQRGSEPPDVMLGTEPGSFARATSSLPAKFLSSPSHVVCF